MIQSHIRELESSAQVVEQKLAVSLQRQQQAKDAATAAHAYVTEPRAPLERTAARTRTPYLLWASCVQEGGSSRARCRRVAGRSLARPAHGSTMSSDCDDLFPAEPLYGRRTKPRSAQLRGRRNRCCADLGTTPQRATSGSVVGWVVRRYALSRPRGIDPSDGPATAGSDARGLAATLLATMYMPRRANSQFLHRYPQVASRPGRGSPARPTRACRGHAPWRITD